MRIEASFDCWQRFIEAIHNQNLPQLASNEKFSTNGEFSNLKHGLGMELKINCIQWHQGDSFFCCFISLQSEKEEVKKFFIYFI